ncbi:MULTISPECIES: LysR family transcriptional regulator [unclassified Colwellia]|uniref:LysR family transcriptional regulator n=1 Tax=unclassified Colwellia TaxID=196834 RepID=UPI0015F3B93D|nr:MULTISPECIES: LysR family transcriptional regulator [unclassified Colwellia]MBA6365367.1 LysR family transcriptional regulator [Colwellia sp. BRX8-8]MBA6348985.1 LysR family transcriptional regulator [Colwellia sp. BRX8-9]MBA6351946.1 LysR family transcriptional regulator [Colwellia sp. BRX9-1]MBA6354960.1 LysR family transcriptional regulator [Colwellia sp. BRX8-3]MBA6359847.1 LysR family transcriptional regulator [Colwellia sp. BRX8-6]|tara:strand:+ start:1720 stop:2586 length:867 start_codon:yes stop_codon:yes gene_type:complete
MQWDGISEFVYVAENESFTLASKKMAISTAQVSRQISALEKRLNIKLFYRTTRKVSLTEEGRVFYQHCRSVLDGLDAAERAITNLQSKPQGKIKLTAPVAYGEKQILPLVNNFIKQYSDVEVSAYLSNRQIDIVEEGYDLAIRLGKLSDSTMMAKKLGKRTNYLCASPQYLEKQGVPHSISELNKHSCLLGTLDYWHFRESDREKSIRVTGRLRYNNGYSLMDAALKGLGIVQLPDYYVQQRIESGELVTLLDNYRAPDEGIWAIYPQNRHLSPKIRLLVDYLAEQLL